MFAKESTLGAAFLHAPRALVFALISNGTVILRGVVCPWLALSGLEKVN